MVHHNQNWFAQAERDLEHAVLSQKETVWVLNQPSMATIDS